MKIREPEKCECEHSSHFQDDSDDDNESRRHTYGSPCHGVEPQKTAFGTFKTCAQCRLDGHMSDDVLKTLA